MKLLIINRYKYLTKITHGAFFSHFWNRGYFYIRLNRLQYRYYYIIHTDYFTILLNDTEGSKKYDHSPAQTVSVIQITIHEYINVCTGCPKNVLAPERFLRRSLGFKILGPCMSTSGLCSQRNSSKQYF